MSTSISTESAVEKAEEYCNITDADEFYSKIRGGEHIHVGLHNHPREPIQHASQRIVPKQLPISTSMYTKMFWISNPVMAEVQGTLPAILDARSPA